MIQRMKRLLRFPPSKRQTFHHYPWKANVKSSQKQILRASIRFLHSSLINYKEKNLIHDATDIPTQSLFKEKKATAIQFNWYETEFEYTIEAQMLVGVDPQNLHLFIQAHQLIFETMSDSKDQKTFFSDRETPISVNQRSSLYLRQTINIPKNVDEDSILAKFAGDTITIRMPKRTSDAVRKDIKLEDENVVK